MSDTSGKKKRRSRKTKEEKTIEKISKEEEISEKNDERPQTNNQPFTMTPEQQTLVQDPSINKKMMEMDVRIRYGFIKTLHNNLISINSRFNWNPEELFAIGAIFRDLQSIELNVLSTVMQNEETEPIEEEDEEEVEDDQEESEEIN